MVREENKSQEEGSHRILLSGWSSLACCLAEGVGVFPSHAPSVQSRPFGFGNSLSLILFVLLASISVKIVLYCVILHSDIIVSKI